MNFGLGVRIAHISYTGASAEKRLHVSMNGILRMWSIWWQTT